MDTETETSSNDPKKTESCRYGDECRSKVCRFNHPTRPSCRDENSCSRIDCWYNHELPFCLFGVRCTNGHCKYRHPPRGSVPNKVAQMSTPTRNQMSETPFSWTEAADQAQPNSSVTHQVQNTSGSSLVTSFRPRSEPTTMTNLEHNDSKISNVARPSWPQEHAGRFVPPNYTEHREMEPSSELTFQNYSTMNSSEMKAMIEHDTQINSVCGHITREKSKRDFDERGEDMAQAKGTIESLGKQLTELTQQVQVFQEMRLRAIRTLREGELTRQLDRELYRFKSRLPALARRPEIERHLENMASRFLIIQGETGSGKSTQVAQYIADHPRFEGKKIICTQPRKIAAITLANRVSMEYSGGSQMSRPGHQIGFHVGGRKIGGQKCRIEFVTEGIMLERIIKGSSDAFNNVGCIVIDEAHERSIICDILLGSFKREDPRWNEILIVVTSATIDLMEFSRYFNNAPTVEIEGRTFPVEMYYNPGAENCDIRKEVVQCALYIHQSAKLTLGYILCFLPGQEDVLQAKETFEVEVSRNNSGNLLQAKVFALFGRQEPDEQTKVFENLEANVRKVIFATDVAETSLTIDGVVYVVDSGVKKEMIFDPKRNVSSLRVNVISKSSAIQRAGRSGRTQLGHCVRLYSQDDFDKMNISTAPEIFRKPLSLAILSLREMNFKPRDFDWISAPTTEAVTAAEEELYYLKALDSDNKATELGKLISESQQEPKLVKMIYRGCQEGHGLAAITIVSILTVSNIFFWNGSDADSKVLAKKHRQGHAQPEGDIITMYRLFEQWLSFRRGRVPDRKDSDLTETLATLTLNSGNTDSVGNCGCEITSQSTLNTQLSNSPEDLERRKNAKKESSLWCRENYVNGKAMGLALSTRNELRALFKGTNIWNQKPSQDNEPSNTEIQRLVLSGYFLHAARSVYCKGGRAHQYFAIHPAVLGSLDFRAAISSHKGAGDLDFIPPTWIIYDKILRLSSTIFPVSSPIEEAWIQEESPEFYDLCVRKTQSLPTEKIVKLVSPECLRSIFGKYFTNLNSLESELGCCLDVDIKSGILVVYCASKKMDEIEAAVDAKLSDVTNTLKNQVIEEEYMGGTRVVVGEGYEVKEILFPQEYTTICIRKLPLNYTKSDIWNLVAFATRDASNAMSIIRTVEITQHETNKVAVVKFFSKLDAKIAYEELRLRGKMMVGGQHLDVIPTGLGPRRGVTQGETCRLRISWPIAKSSGRASVAFTSPIEANKFIDNISYLFPGARISRVHGENRSTSGFRGRMTTKNKPLPPTTDLDSGGLPMVGQCRIRFVPVEMPAQDFEYKLTVVDLREDIDEYEIFARVKPAIPKWVKVDRNLPKEENNEYCLSAEERTEKLLPLCEFITERIVTTDFLDKNLGRAELYVHFEDKLSLQRAYRGAEYFALGETFGQQHRMEIEYTHATSVHSDLHKFLEEDIDRIKRLAWKKGVKTSEFAPKGKAKFVTLKFRSCNANVIRLVQERLEDVSNCTKFICEGIELLFTWTGRTHLTELAKRTFLHCDYRTHGVWIYGKLETQKNVSAELRKIIDMLKSLEVFDKPFLLNKKKVDLTKTETDVAKMSRLCTACELKHFQFSGNKIFASGSKVAVEKLENYLEQDASLFVKRPSKVAGSKGLPDCGICFCPTDENFLLSSLCGHAFCMECIQPMFDIQPLQFPIVCQECQVPFVINDITQCATQSKLRKFLEHAVFKFQDEHGDDIRICPKLGCNQLLSYAARRSGEYGGDFVFCDECVTTYCVSCSGKLGKPVKCHDYDSCDDIQNGPTDEVREHVKQIQERIFNLSCPRCNVVFYEFTGCAAVTCDSCKCAFCGICLKDCGQDSHAHVKECSKNPKRGDYFISETQLNQIHRKMRVEKLTDYIRKIENPEVKNGIHRAIRRDLLDLRIKDTEIGL